MQSIAVTTERHPVLPLSEKIVDKLYTRSTHSHMDTVNYCDLVEDIPMGSVADIVRVASMSRILLSKYLGVLHDHLQSSTRLLTATVAF